jgi:hypothetical protein
MDEEKEEEGGGGGGKRDRQDGEWRRHVGGAGWGLEERFARVCVCVCVCVYVCVCARLRVYTMRVYISGVETIVQTVARTM